MLAQMLFIGKLKVHTNAEIFQVITFNVKPKENLAKLCFYILPLWIQRLSQPKELALT